MLQQIVSHLQHSSHTAFVIKDVSYSYKELKVLVDRFYAYLMQHPEHSLVGIVAHNDLPSYAMLIATVLSNSGYIILNPAHPGERNTRITSEAGLNLVFSSNTEDNASLPSSVEFIALADIPTVIEDIVYFPPDKDSTAYVLFTSGSTGKPKGVKISKGNLEAMLQSLAQLPLTVSSGDRVLQMFDLSFDGSVLMLFMGLCAGAAIYTTDPSRIKYLEIARLLHTYQLSFVFLVPSVIALLKPFLPSLVLPSVTTLIVGAEAVSYSRLQSILPCMPNATIWNLYGPTEATVCVMAYRMDSHVEYELHNDLIPIGKPMPGVQHLIVRDGIVVTEADIKGELYIGGEQVCQGYINDELQNQTAFSNLDWEGRPQRFYATGDIVFRNKYGNYMYCGRKDRQVKIQGNRIELAEIEYHASQLTDREVVAVVRDVDGVQSLHLFVENYAGDDNAIIRYLDTKLPSCMIPTQIVKLSVLPRTTNDKTDIQALLNMLEQGRD